MPQIFVSSSSEAKEIDILIRSKLEELGATPMSWKDFGIFPSGSYTLIELLNLPAKIDGALLIATADDLIECRGDKRYSPRDNIVLEMGIFLSQLGNQRTGIIHVKDTRINVFPRLPTNLDGLTTLRFEPELPLNFDCKLSNWLETIVSLRPKTKLLDELNTTIFRKLSNCPDQWSSYLDQYIISPFRQSVENIGNGSIELSIDEYFHSLYKETDAADSSTEIMAVSTLSSRIWTQDREQQYYIKKNIEATTRGTQIRRIFILKQRDSENFKKVLEMQKKSGIQVKFATSSLLIGVEGLKDMAIFINKKSGIRKILLVDEVLGNPNRIYRAKLLLDHNSQDNLIKEFEKAWEISYDYSHKLLSEIFNLKKKNFAKAPGENMKAYELEHPVISCKEAASAKGIPLVNELKSLIIQTSKGIICLHTTGDAKVSYRAIKQFLQVKEAYIAPDETLKKLGLSPGTVSAVLEPVWSLPHLINRRVLKQKYVSTNNGTLRGYFKFDPKILETSKSNQIGDFD